VHGMRRDTRQHVGEPCLWINMIHFGGDNETVHHRRALPSTIGKGLIIPWFRQRKLSFGTRFIL